MPESQLSQISDVYASSVYDDSTTDTLPPILSNDFPPNLSLSQQSFNSGTPLVTDSIEADCTRPPQLPPIPPSLRRVCPDRITTYIVYGSMGQESEEFTKWWIQTNYGVTDSQKTKRRMNWDAQHSSEVWKHFDQVAAAKDGKPKVICKQCKAVLDHPQLGNGTSTMIKHVKGSGCQRKVKGAGIKQFLQQQVWSNPIHSITLLIIKLYLGFVVFKLIRDLAGLLGRGTDPVSYRLPTPI